MKRGIVLAALLLLCLPVAVYATVNEVTPAKNDYLGSGSTTVFPYTFKILDKANIQVLVNGLVQLVDTNYSVSGVGDSGGGSITLFSAPALNVKVTLLRKQPVQQSSTYTSNEAFPATRLMSDLDKNIMVDQMQMEALDRAIKFRPESIYRSVAINDPVANQCLVWNSTATMINSQACGTGGGGGSGAPLTATYILKTPNSLLPNAQALSVLNSGAMMSTTVTGAVSIYTGSTCVGTFFRGLNASLSATCEAVSLTADTTGILLPAKGGTGAGAFTAGSIPFIGASGVYTQNNG